ncbi:MAG: sugar ABC transporter permease, partial [Bacilli bacterium]
MTEQPNLKNTEKELEVENLSIGTYAEGATLQVAKPKWFMPEWLKAIIALAPALFFLIIFMIYPIINTFLLSFLEDFSWIGGSKSSFAIINWLYSLNPDFRGNPAFWSINNYINVLKDTAFLSSLGNTALMVIVSVPLTITISLLIAVCLNSIKILKGFFQTVFFLPYVTNAIALGMVFNVMFSRGGPINSLLGFDFNWLLQAAGASRWTMFAVITIYSTWNGLAFKILVFMSGLATIDKQYYDAARIDGASKLKIFARITVPLLSPQILYITITSFIGAFKAYTSVIALFGNEIGRASC